MLLLISGAISNSNAVIRQEFRKLRLQMIDDTEVSCLSELQILSHHCAKEGGKCGVCR
jgi:hypothetical protein